MDCKQIWQSPTNTIVFKPDRRFGTGWYVRNTGTVAWEPGSVEFVYLAGARLANDFVVQLTTTVSPGESIILSVGMRSPLHAGKYTTRWVLRQGGIYFCPVMLTITVRP